jgi:beta-glucosidase
MPWLGQVKAVLEAWYPGSGGGPAIARLLYGRVEPAGHLPITFPDNVAQLPRPTIAQPPLTLRQLEAPDSFTYWQTQSKVDQEILYPERADLGYRWFERTGGKPLFPFGYGLGYTSFGYASLTVADRPDAVSVSVSVRNTGHRPGRALVQIYVAPPGQPARLAGWAAADLAPGQARAVTLLLSLRSIASFDVARNRWTLPAGSYEVRVGRWAGDRVLVRQVPLRARVLPP